MDWGRIVVQGVVFGIPLTVLALLAIGFMTGTIR